MRETTRTSLLWMIVATCWFWGAWYVFRTSFVEDGERFFTLWDDGMISMQYARNLVLGHGLVWNPGEDPVQGYSNPAVTLCMALVHLLPLPLSKVSLGFQLVNLILFAGLVWLSARVSRRMFPEADALASLSAALAVGCCAPVAVWTLQGSDVGFVTLCLLLFLDLLSGPKERCDRVLPWVAGLAVLVRFDMAIFSAIALIASLLLPGEKRRTLVRGAVVMVVGIVALLTAGQFYYGDPLPNTFYLKATGSPRADVLGWGVKDLMARLPGMVPALVLAMVAIGLVWRRSAAIAACVGFVVTAMVYNTWVGGDWLPLYGSRFVAPTLPGLLILAANGAWLSLQPRVRPVLLAPLIAFVAWEANAPKSNADWFFPSISPMYREQNQENVRSALYLREHSDVSTTIAVHWGGIPPYFSQRRAIDVLGKSDRHIARTVSDTFYPGHSKYDWDYVLNQRKPDVFVTASPALLARKDFLTDYERARPRGIELYVRRESVDKFDAEDLNLESRELHKRRSPRGRGARERNR